MKSIMHSVALSLVTYTYNDAALCHELLDHLRTWSVQPREIIVVDDCSTVPFVSTYSNVQVIRLPKNLGPTGAKATGLAAARFPIILSIDCDIRIADDWIERALPYLRKPQVGLVSSSVLCTGDDDDVSRYVKNRYSFCPENESVPFVPGCIFMMLRSVYHNVGGLAGHTLRVHEDAYLCRALRLMKYTLIIAKGLTAYQKRTLSMVACIRRFFTWDMPYFSRTIQEGKEYSEQVGTFILGNKAKTAHIFIGEEHLHYFDLLYILYGSLSLAKQYSEAHMHAAWNAFSDILQSWPAIFATIRKDMYRFFPQYDFTTATEQNKNFANISVFFNQVFPPSLCELIEIFLQKNQLYESKNTSFSLYENGGKDVY